MYIIRITIATENQTDWKNKGGTSFRFNCKCGNWKNHWENFSGKDFFLQKCSVLGCSNLAEQTAHIFRSEDGMFEWLAPLCRSCNHSTNTESFDLKIGSVLVNANRKETCD